MLERLQLEAGRTPTRERDAEVPIWTHPSGYDMNGAAQMTICCPECLRAFSEVAGDFRGGVQETVCTHCRTRFCYAAVPSLTALAPQRARNAGMNVAAELPQFDN
jgi:hypothetical protein